EMIERGRRLVAARGGDVGPDDPFVRLLEEAKQLRGRIHVEIGDAKQRTAAIAELRSAYDRARVLYRERPNDTVALADYVRAAGVYANQAAMHRDADPDEMARALEAVGEALAKSAHTDESIGLLYHHRRLCRYARGLVLVRLERLPEAFDVAMEIDDSARARDPADPFTFRMAADLWSELLGTETDPDARDELRELTLVALEAAVEVGFNDAKDLRSVPALDAFRDEPRFQALLETIEGPASEEDG
ncbi:MAG: hypothetical protein AAGB93_06415, partial [Planctomycetota bacterium]